MALKIFFLIFLLICFVIMSSVMVVFERNKTRRIIFWLVLFALTSVVGFIVYVHVKLLEVKKLASLKTKREEDRIYTNLISNNLRNVSTEKNDDLFKFNNIAYGTKILSNTNFEFFATYSNYKKDILSAIKNAKSYIILELNSVYDFQFDDFKVALLKKTETVDIRLIYSKFISKKMKKSLKQAGIKVSKFNKVNYVCSAFNNLRNAIVVDGVIAYVGNINNDEISIKKECTNLYFKLQGDLVEELDLAVRQDTIFASGKYIDYEKVKSEKIQNSSLVQLISNEVEWNLELLLVKAISTAKKSILLELKDFIPNESIMSLLKFAINSNIDVRLIIPIKTNSGATNFASRAYAKELAQLGVNVYLYDGIVGFNSISIDDKYVLFGSFSINRDDVLTSLQHIFIVDDQKIALYFRKLFDSAVNNSYRINNAKYMLFREKIFKKIM